jgi:hypothetical protein
MGFFASRLRGWRTALGKDRIDPSQIKAGATFARTGARDVMETARVISIEEHAGGVPHVRYACRLQHASTVLEDGPRTLALPAFIERFRAPSQTIGPRAQG